MRQGDDAAHGLGPSRARVLALLQDAGEPMTSTEVATRLGVHANSARFHLDALTESGLVTRGAERRSTPGRPRTLYSPARGATRAAHRSYRLLAGVLASVLSDQAPDAAALTEDAGRRWGHHLAPALVDDPQEPESLETVIDALDQVGFDSHLVEEGGSLRMEVNHCPFLEVAEGHRDVVCSVHLGLMRGLLERTGAGVSVGTLEPLVEPSRCIAHLERRTATGQR